MCSIILISPTNCFQEKLQKIPGFQSKNIGMFTSERTTTTSTTTTTKRITTTTRRKIYKPLMVSRTKPMVAPANIPVSTKAARNPSSDWTANDNGRKMGQNDRFPEVLPLSPPPTKLQKDKPESSTNENAEISTNQKLTKMHIQAGNASSLTLEGKKF